MAPCGSWPPGANALARVGAGFSSKFVTFVLAPEFTYSQNLGFQTFPGTQQGRSVWSSPWHTGNASADLPASDSATNRSRRRHSARVRSPFTLAQSTLGVSSENQWWGPGIRNALLLSNQAEGVPHVFARSARPIVTGIGDFEWRVIGGALSESAFFDTISTNNTRSLSGFIVTWQPAVAPHVTVGVARIVVAPSSGARTLVEGAFNAVTQWHTEQHAGYARRFRCAATR